MDAKRSNFDANELLRFFGVVVWKIGEDKTRTIRGFQTATYEVEK